MAERVIEYDDGRAEADAGTGVVDIVAIREEDNLCILGMVDLEPWVGREHLNALHERLTLYTEYWQSGQLLADFPAARYAAIQIKVFFKHEPDADGLAFLEQTSAAIETLGIGFTYELLPD